MSDKKTKKGNVLAYLRKHGSITWPEAYHNDCGTRLSARIKDLEEDGFCFHRVREPELDERGKETGHHTRYFLLPVFEGRQEQ